MRLWMFITAALLSLAAVAQAADWPQFMGPNGDATSAEKGLLRTFPPEGPKVLWTVKLAPGFGPAAVRDGEVYLLDRVGTAETLRCLDLATGQPKWDFAYDTPAVKYSYDGGRSTPSVSPTRVYTIGPTGVMHCIDRATHAAVWKKDLLAEYGAKMPNWAVAQSPLLYKDVVIVAPLSGSAGLAALDQATGQERWRSAPVGAMAYASPRLLTIDGLDQIVIVNNSGATAVDARDGKPLWSFPHKCGIAIPNVSSFGGGKLFITGGYKAGSAIFQVARQGDAWTATPLATVDLIGGQTHPGIVYDGHIYILCNTNERNDGMVCFDAAGQIAWQTNKDPWFDKGGSLLTGDHVMYQVDGETGDLYSLDPSPAGFKVLAKAKMLEGKTIWAPLALADGKLLIRDQRQMKCLDVRAQ